MSQKAHTATAIFTTTSCVIGGANKAVSEKPIYLAVHLYKVLFCAIEEGFGYTLKEKIERLHKSFPDVSFIFIYHTTKSGKFKGVNSHAHEVDVIIQVEKGVASSTGRFSAGGRLEM